MEDMSKVMIPVSISNELRSVKLRYALHNVVVGVSFRKAAGLGLCSHRHQTSFVLPLLLFFSSHSMTSVKRTSFPENFPSTRTRTRVSRKPVILTVSMWHSMESEAQQKGLLDCTRVLPWRQFHELQQAEELVVPMANQSTKPVQPFVCC